MTFEERCKALQDLIVAVREEAFTREYRDQVSDAEVLGLIVSQWSEWDGNRIVEVAIAALEDANFHPEAANLKEFWFPEG